MQTSLVKNYKLFLEQDALHRSNGIRARESSRNSTEYIYIYVNVYMYIYKLSSALASIWIPTDILLHTYVTYIYGKEIGDISPTGKSFRGRMRPHSGL